MNIQLKLRVLLFIHKNGKIIIPKKLLTPHYGFQRLRSEGLIRITKDNGRFYGVLSEKGEAFIAAALSDYRDKSI